MKQLWENITAWFAKMGRSVVQRGRHVYNADKDLFI
ncbi:MAG: hypothetical protein RL660_1452 [Bacteroidota bacterium]